MKEKTYNWTDLNLETEATASCLIRNPLLLYIYHFDDRCRLLLENTIKQDKDGRWNKFRQITTALTAMTQVNIK